MDTKPNENRPRLNDEPALNTPTLTVPAEKISKNKHTTVTRQDCTTQEGCRSFPTPHIELYTVIPHCI